MSRPATVRQREAIEQHDRSMVVTAGAGTGKTFVLVGKYLSLIEKEGLRPREILAMTFTDKAAAEMKERVRETVGKRIEAEPDNQFWKTIAEEVIIAPIMTFHSFCSQILREFAIEAGLEPGFLIIDEGQALAIRRDAFDLLLKKPGSDAIHDALIRILAQVEKFRLHEILSVIADYPDWFLEFYARLDRDREGLIEEWQEFVRSVREPAVTRFFADPENTRAIADLIRYSRRYGGGKDTAVSYLELISPHLADISPDVSPERLSQAVQAFLSARPRGRIGTLKVWEQDDLEDMRRAKAKLTASLEKAAPYFDLILDPASPLTTATLSFFSDLALLSEEYLGLLADQKRQASGIDFGDLIALTKRFLKENQELVSLHLRPRIRYILVDEFQDTDPAQFEIICAIIGELSQGTRSLFIVGDPKQSIYLFRDADVTRFKEAQHRVLADCNGRAINLDTSFRSSREVIGVVNHLFRTIFKGSEKAWEFGYEPILTCEERMQSRGSVQILLPGKAPSGGTVSDSKEIEAGMVADLVHHIVNTAKMEVMDRDGRTRPAGYGDIAILIERRTHLSRYMDALSSKEAPFYVHGGIGFYSRQEIYDIYNLLSFLLRPYDDAALYGILRSPYFSLSDTTLFTIMNRSGFPRGFTLLERMQRYLSDEPEDAGPCPELDLMKRAVFLLSEWLKHAGREPVVLFITRIIRESGILTVYGAQELGEQQIANLEKLVQIVRGRAENGGYGLWNLIHEMTVSIGTEEREGEAALDTVSQTSVNIMTVHASKGLEFPIVILPDMGSSREGRQPSVLIGDLPGCLGVKLPDPTQEYEIRETPVYQALQLIRREKEAAERKRLFYVGATRARDHLVLCGRRPDTWFETVEEGTTRIDWVCTLLGITAGTAETGGSAWIDPDDGRGIIEIRVHNSPQEMTRQWAYDQPGLLTPQPEYLHRRGERQPVCSSKETSQERKERRVWSLSRILEADLNPARDQEMHREFPDRGALTPDEIGTILHLIFSGTRAETALSRFGITSPDAAEFCRSRYEEFKNQPLMKEVVEEYCELAFMAEIGGMTIEGRMDRLCRTSEGTWMVIDYKSGGCSHAVLQMAVYRQAAEMLTGKPVIPYLYLIQAGTFASPPDISREEMEHLITACVARLEGKSSDR